MSRESKRLRASLEDRAGTKIDYNCPVHYFSPDGLVCHGFVDRRLRIYQGGGERAEIVNYRMDPPMLSLMRTVWSELLRIAREEDDHGLEDWWWEMIDHHANVVFRISFDKALKVGGIYKTRAGVRFGVPLKFVDLVDADGHWLQRGEPVPPPPKLIFGVTPPDLYKPLPKVPKVPKVPKERS